MNRQKGLLAFLCAAIAATCAVVQLPVVEWVERMFGNAPPPLAIHLKSVKETRLRTGPGGGEPVTVQALREDRRPDPEIEKLARAHHLPFGVLKAHLAVTSQGVRGTEGLFWSRLPEGDEELPDDGLLRTHAAAALLGRYQKETGSLQGALMAWKVGAYRARRATAPHLHMLAFHRHSARTYLCTILGLAAALDTQWPIEAAGVRAPTGVRAPAGVHAPMPGRVSFAGIDGPRGRCVVLTHVCDFSTEICGLDRLEVNAGQKVQQGQKLGMAEPGAARFGFRLGQRILDPAAIRPEGEEEP